MIDKFNFYWKYFEQPKRRIEGVINKIFKRDNKFIIQREVKKCRNELMLDSPFNIVRLLGWTDIKDDDYYYVIYTRKNGIELSPCCCGFVRLKNRLSGFEYYQAEMGWELNTPPLKDILREVKKKKIKLL